MGEISMHQPPSYAHPSPPVKLAYKTDFSDVCDLEVVKRPKNF